MNSAGRGEPVCRPGLVGLQNRTERSVSCGVGADQVGHVPTSPVDPGSLWHRNQSFADGPAGPDITRRPVGTDGMHEVHDADRPTAGGPVGQLFNIDPLYQYNVANGSETRYPGSNVHRLMLVKILCG